MQQTDHLVPQMSQASVAAAVPAFSKCDDAHATEEYRHIASSSAASSSGESTVTSNNNGIRTLPLRSFYIEPLLELYYDYFHGSHPCVLPALLLKRQLSDGTPGISLLVSVMRFIGSLYSPSIPSGPLNDEVKRAIAQPQPWTSGYEVQALTLYSIAAFWCDDSLLAEEMLDRAANKALAIGMNLKHYATENSGGDIVLAESWRRTWWQIYITDMHITATSPETNLRVSQRHIIATVDLPCEEDEYSSGNIPKPRTMDEYDYRDCAADKDAGFSSYAYLIGLLRSLDYSIYGVSRPLKANVKTLCTKTDESIAAWLLLLPKNKQKLFTEDGSFDEVLFKANSLLQVYTIDIHRQQSTLPFHPIKNNLHSFRRPALDRLDDRYYEEESLHTAKILHAIEKMTYLLTLPIKLAVHTPFTIYIVATITIAHLSACKHVLRGKHLQTARERIRVAMGALGTFAEVWPRGQRVVREVKIIARELLELPLDAGSSASSKATKMDMPKPDEPTLRLLNEESATTAEVSSAHSCFSVGEGSMETCGLPSLFAPFPTAGDRSRILQ